MDEDTRKKSLKYSVLDGAFYSVMQGFIENFITPFALALNATVHEIGIIASVPQFLGALLQLPSADLTDRIKDRRLVILVCVLIQVLGIIPLFLVPFLTRNIMFIIIFYSLYFISGQFANAPWNSMMGDLVKPEERGSYFGRRNQITGFVSFLILLAAGFVLDVFRSSMVGFAILFGVSAIARLLSFFYLARMYEPPYAVSENDYFSLLDFIKRSTKSNYANFVFFVGMVRFSVNLAAPFFAVYMLRDLGLGPINYAILTLAQTVAMFITMTYWSRYADLFGNRKIFFVTSAGIASLPLLWIFSSNFYYLFMLQVYSGFVWAGFNLSISNFILDAVTPQKRARCTAYYNFFVGLGNLFGGILGGYLLLSLPTLFFRSNILTLFIISTAARVLAGAIFFYRIKEVRPVKEIRHADLFWKVIAIEPANWVVNGGLTIIHGAEKISSSTIAKIEREFEKEIRKKN